MRWWAFALFFAVVGVLSGIVDYTMVGMGYDNWYDQSTPDMTVIDLSEDDVATLTPSGNDYDATGAMSTLKYLGIFYSMGKGVLLVTAMLDDFLVYDVAGINLFAPILAMFQLLIWAIYVMGFVQIVLKISAKGME